MQAVVETPDFAADARRARIAEDELEAMIGYIAEHPTAGDLIPGTGGARKIRFRGRGKGKSGGYRVITYYGGEDLPVFLLNIFAKGHKEDLTGAERNELRSFLSRIAATYRQDRTKQ